MSQAYSWFDTTPTYEGFGTETTYGAQQASSGHFRITFDETGLSDPSFGIGTKSLSVATVHGTFSMNCQSSNHIPDAQFETTIVSPIQYWVLPLVNFVSSFQDDRTIFDDHPMRLRRATDHFKAARAQLEPYGIPVQSTVIGFAFANERAFIEALPDCAARESRLEQRTDDVLITAVMIGRVPDGVGVDLDGLDDWFPYNLLSLLSLATDRFVGAPWIEFRDESGRLIKRIHRQLNVQQYTRGRSSLTIPNVSLLLSDCLRSPWFKDRVLSTVVRRLIRSLVYRMTLDDRFNHLCRTLECLYTIYPPEDRKQRNPSEALDNEDRQFVSESLMRAAERIRERARSLKRDGKVLEARALYRLADRAMAVPKWSPDLRDKLTDMLREAGFADAEVAGRCYSADEEKGRKAWLNEIYKRRNTTTHEGSFTFSGPVEQPLETARLADHLHDIIARLILSLYAYRGRYRPFVMYRDSGTTRYCGIDWVHPDRKPEHIGYEPIGKLKPQVS